MFKEVHVDDIVSRAGAPQIVTLLAYYRSLSMDGALPSYADFNPERLAEHASNLEQFPIWWNRLGIHKGREQ